MDGVHWRWAWSCKSQVWRSIGWPEYSRCTLGAAPSSAVLGNAVSSRKVGKTGGCCSSFQCLIKVSFRIYITLTIVISDILPLFRTLDVFNFSLFTYCEDFYYQTGVKNIILFCLLFLVSRKKIWGFLPFLNSFIQNGWKIKSLLLMLVAWNAMCFTYKPTRKTNNGIPI